MAQEASEADEVKAANLRFYDAFSGLDMKAMEQAWEQSERVLCTHPGWPVLRGWERVRKSWEDIFYNTTLMHFTITDANVVVQGDCAWINCVENITSVVDGRAANFAVQATNIFSKGENGWTIVHHHASA